MNKYEKAGTLLNIIALILAIFGYFIIENVPIFLGIVVMLWSNNFSNEAYKLIKIGKETNDDND